MIFIFPNTPQLTEYLQYNNPNVGVVRTGQIGDEYVQRGDNLPVINGFITLLEIPSDRFGVQISGFVEIDQDYYNRVGYIAENEILVYYPSGIVMFNPAHEGKTFFVNYEGRGVILLSADRVYMMYQKNPSVIVTLTDFANEIKSQLRVVNQRIKKYEEVAEYTLKIAEDARLATDQSKDATYHSIIATDRANDAAASTVMIYKNPVPTYEELGESYPNPENGYRVMVLTTGDVYRYDAIYTRSWQLIDNITKYLIPIVTEEYDGILSKDDYRKLQSKPFDFVFQKVTNGGIQDNIVQSPYDGWLNKCYAYMNNNQSDSPIEIEVQMITFEDFEKLHDGIDEDDQENPIEKRGWRNIFKENIIIEPSQYYGQGKIESPYQNVEKNTFYRVNFKQFDNKMGGITIRWDMWMKEPVAWGTYHLNY